MVKLHFYKFGSIIERPHTLYVSVLKGAEHDEKKCQ